jgi:hypothetical protein
MRVAARIVRIAASDDSRHMPDERGAKPAPGKLLFTCALYRRFRRAGHFRTSM